VVELKPTFLKAKVVAPTKIKPKAMIKMSMRIPRNRKLWCRCIVFFSQSTNLYMLSWKVFAGSAFPAVQMFTEYLKFFAKMVWLLFEAFFEVREVLHYFVDFWV
jgi:hypothetical protein